MLTRNQKILSSITIFLLAIFSVHFYLLSRIQQTFVDAVNRNPDMTLNFANKHVFSNRIDAEVTIIGQAATVNLQPSYLSRKVFFSTELQQSQFMPLVMIFGTMPKGKPTYELNGHFNPLNNVLTVGTNDMSLPIGEETISFSRAEIALQMDDSFQADKLVGVDIHDLNATSLMSIDRLHYDSTRSSSKSLVVTSKGVDIVFDEELLQSYANSDASSLVSMIKSPLNYDLSFSADQQLISLFTSTDHQITDELNAKLDLLISEGLASGETQATLAITPKTDDFDVNFNVSGTQRVTDQEAYDAAIANVYKDIPNYQPPIGLTKTQYDMALKSILLQNGDIQNIKLSGSTTSDFIDRPQLKTDYSAKLTSSTVQLLPETLKQVRLNGKVITLGEGTPNNYVPFAVISVKSNDSLYFKLLAPEFEEISPEGQYELEILFSNPPGE